MSDYVITTVDGDRAVLVTVTSFQIDGAAELERAVCEAIEGCVADDQVVDR